jgi:hypothetical protein
VEVFAAPAVGDVELLIHGTSLTRGFAEGKLRLLREGNLPPVDVSAHAPVGPPADLQADPQADIDTSVGPFLLAADESLRGQQMQVSVDVTDEMRREAEGRGLPIVDYVELLIEKGRNALTEGGVVSSAIERIRALRAKNDGPRQ